MDTMEKGESETNKDTSIDIYTLTVQQIASANVLNSTGSSAWCSVMTQRGGMGADGKETQEAGDIYIHTHTADSYCCTA